MKRYLLAKFGATHNRLSAGLKFYQSRRDHDDQSQPSDRHYWITLLDKIATPVLSNMANDMLKRNMPIKVSPNWDNRNKNVAYMEAFGRLIAGIAPFLACTLSDPWEKRIQQRLHAQAALSLAHAVNPESSDRLYWGSPQTRQPLVDAAYIAQAFLMAPKQLWQSLDANSRDRFIAAFKGLRQIEAWNNNWVLFAAVIECFLMSIGEDVAMSRIQHAIEKMEQWYLGDGWYSDGDRFHFDHYNGYVIHPMFVQILKTYVAFGHIDPTHYHLAYKRMQRYASFQERFISPEGTYPIIGRSSTYRVGAFWPLTKLALEKSLPTGIKPAQVRCALTKVMKNIFIPATFTKGGWLRLGLVGSHQNDLADHYSNTGSMYITSMVFWPLGLPASDDFWAKPFAEWTQLKCWTGKPINRDFAVEY